MTLKGYRKRTCPHCFRKMFVRDSAEPLADHLARLVEEFEKYPPEEAEAAIRAHKAAKINYLESVLPQHVPQELADATIRELIELSAASASSAV